MLISRHWLNEFVALNVSTEELCHKLTSLGLEVESVKKAAPDFEQVVIGRVVDLIQHPDADKLRVATVDIGSSEGNLQIVCGAPNVAIGELVPTAIIGAVLPENFKIKKSKLRGVESFGMLCSAKELGINEDASGLMLLPADAPIGQNIREYLNLDDDIIELGITPNRGDCLSALGIARELSAAYNLPLKYVDDYQSDQTEENSVNVELIAKEVCPKYLARTFKNINNEESSPIWLVERLRRSGIRSLSPIVDITNYVMLEFGVPMHAFSADIIDGDIKVRMAEKDEKMTLLDGKEIILDDDLLVIADNNKPIALAGIMGGKFSAVEKTTTNIVLESAWFNPSVIVGKAKRFGLTTDAGYRFERGVDYKTQELAMDRASQLILQICGGSTNIVSSKIASEFLPESRPITLTGKKVNRYLGVNLSKKNIVDYLTSLGMTIAETDKMTFDVIAPSYRFDINIEEDLIEELARLWGYDNIPVAPLVVQKIKGQKSENTFYQELHQAMRHIGYQEAITYSFIDKDSSKAIDPNINNEGFSDIELINPISEELSIMRSSLLPSLLKALVHNTNRQQKQVRLYEIGSSYNRESSGSIKQTEKLAGIVYGQVHDLQWGYRERLLDFFDIKGDLEYIISLLDVQNVEFKRSDKTFLHPGQSADIYINNQYAGFIGTLHPTLQNRYDLDEKAFYFEINTIELASQKQMLAQTISKYPEIRRDVSVLMGQGYEVQEVINAIISASNDFVVDVKLFDVYVGRNIPRGTKSLTIAIYLQDKTKTLTDEIADETMKRITQNLTEKFNAELRG